MNGAAGRDGPLGVGFNILPGCFETQASIFSSQMTALRLRVVAAEVGAVEAWSTYIS